MADSNTSIQSLINKPQNKPVLEVESAKGIGKDKPKKQLRRILLIFLFIALLGVSCFLIYEINRAAHDKKELATTKSDLEKLTASINNQVDCRKYALPYVDTGARFTGETKDKIIRLPRRDVAIGATMGISRAAGNGDGKTRESIVGVQVYIKYLGPVPTTSPIQIAAEDFSLEDEDGRKGLLTEYYDNEMIPLELNIPRRSQNVYLDGGKQIVGQVFFIVDKDSDNFTLTYSPSDISEKAVFSFTTKLPEAM
jgi:hypothetical protein